MALVQVSPKASARPYLPHAGVYGWGQMHDMEAVLTKIEAPSKTGPGWDYECKKDSYVEFTIKVVHPEMGLVFVKDHQPMGDNSGSKALQYLRDLAPELVSEEGEFDPELFGPIDCNIEVTDAVEDRRVGKEGLMYSGNIRNIASNN